MDGTRNEQFYWNIYLTKYWFENDNKNLTRNRFENNFVELSK